MPRYVAFLRGVMPTNAKMADLRRAFEAAGFREVKTVLASGNVAFDARAAGEATLARKAEAAMYKTLGRSFRTIVRRADALQSLVAKDPFKRFRPPARGKRVVTFLRDAARAAPRLPIEIDGARIHGIEGREVFTSYLPSARGPVFMTLIQKTFGDDVTTRTWETVRKCAAA